MMFTPPELAGSKEDKELKAREREWGISATSNGMTLNDFCDMYRGDGLFVVGLNGNPDADSDLPEIKDKKHGHIVYANLSRHIRRPGFIDTINCGEMNVLCFMRVNRRVPPSDPLHYQFDPETRKFIV